MPADGGPAHRRTYLGANTPVRGWTPDGRIIFMSDAGRRQPRRLRHLDRRPGGGRADSGCNVGPATELVLRPATASGWSSDATRSTPPGGSATAAARAATSGSTATARATSSDCSNLDRQPRVAAVGGRPHLLPVRPRGHRQPLLVHARPEAASGGTPTTSEYYARWAQTDGTRIVYQTPPRSGSTTPTTDTSERIDIDLRSPRVAAQPPLRRRGPVHARVERPSRRPLDRGQHARQALHDAAVGAGRRGSTANGTASATGSRSGRRDGKSLVCISDEGGEEALEIYSTDDTSAHEAARPLDIGRAIELVTSPAADEVVIANHRNELVWVDLARRTEQDPRPERAQRASRAPSGRRTAATSPTACADDVADGVDQDRARPRPGTTRTVTRPEFHDVAPSFDPEGRYLYFLSYRVFDPVYDTLFFELGFPRACARTSSRCARTSRRRSSRSHAGSAAQAGGRTEKRTTSAKDARRRRPNRPRSTTARPQAQAGRRSTSTASPTASSRSRCPRAGTRRSGASAARCCSRASRSQGRSAATSSTPTDEPKGKLEAYDLERAEARHDRQRASAQLPGLGRRLDARVPVRAASCARCGPGEKPAPEEGEREAAPGRRHRLDRPRPHPRVRRSARRVAPDVPRSVALPAEHFWVADMSGVDWDAIYDALPSARRQGREPARVLRPDVGDARRARDVARLRDGRRPSTAAAVPRRTSRRRHRAARTDRWVIEHIVRGDCWDPAADSPLDAPGVQVEEGDAILAVNGQPTSTATSAGAAARAPGRRRRRAHGGDARGRNPRGSSYVKTLVDDTAGALPRVGRDQPRARPRARRTAASATSTSRTWARRATRSSTATTAPRSQHDGLIVDVRFNGGGHVSQLLIEKLARERIGYDVTRWGKPEPYPSDSPAGPLVCLTNELAGSDGDIFTHVFKLKGLGPVVGKRTWGGVVGITCGTSSSTTA